MTDNFFADDKTRAESAAVDATADLPVAYIYNDKDGRGQNGGLFINLRDLPPDIQLDKDVVREFSTEHPDSTAPGGFKREPGILLPAYHLVLVAFDHDAQGRPNAWKQETTSYGQVKDKWVFYGIAGIWQAWSDTRPFKVKYGGATSAISMSTHVRNFDRYIVGEATNVIRTSNPNAASASRNQFLLPVRHEGRLVGQAPNQSWACPVVEYEEAGLRVESNGRRSGISTLKRYADDHELLKQLFLPKLLGDVGGQRALLAMSWTDKYRDLVKNTESAGAAQTAGGEHFTEDEKESIDEQMIGRVNELAAQAGTVVDQEIQVLRGSNVLKGGDGTSNILNLSKAGGRLLIGHLTEMARARSAQVPPAQQQSPAQTQTQTAQAPATQAAPKSSVPW